MISNNKQKSFGSPMGYKDSILGSSKYKDQETFAHQRVADINMYSAEQLALNPHIQDEEDTESPQGVITNGREHLKRKARRMKHSKYDDESFIVDYSGNSKKCRNSELQGSSHCSPHDNGFYYPHPNYEKSGSSLPDQVAKGKRMVKLSKKQLEKENNHANLFSQI